MAEFIITYWMFFFVAAAAFFVAGIAIANFVKKPNEEQIQKVKEWLLYAVVEAERNFGTETGQIKLRYVYDLFVMKFPFLVAVISFDKFSEMVDEVLDRFEELLKENKALVEYINY